MLRRVPAARFATGAARPAAQPKSALAAAKPAAKTSAPSASVAKAGAKAKKGAKAGKVEVVAAVVEKPRYVLKDVFAAPIKEWQKTATYKDITRKMHEAHKKIPTFKPSQELIETLVNRAETKVQLRRSVKLYVKDILEDPLVRQEPRQRLMDAIFRRVLQMGDHRFAFTSADIASYLKAMRLVREPGYRIWPSQRLLQSAMHQWTFTPSGKARAAKVVGTMWDLFRDKADLTPSHEMLSTALRALSKPPAVPEAMRIATRHASALAADHYGTLYRIAFAASDSSAIEALLALRAKHLADAQFRQSPALVKFEVQARLTLDGGLAPVVALFDSLSDAQRAELLKSLLVESAQTRSLAAAVSALWAASATRNAPPAALAPYVPLLQQLEPASADLSAKLRAAAPLQEAFARLDALAAKKASKKEKDEKKEATTNSKEAKDATEAASAP